MNYPVVHPNNVEFVEIIRPTIENGPWIAGGAALNWYLGKPVLKNDIDIFCRSHKQFEELLNRIRSYGTIGGNKRSFEVAATPNAVSYRCESSKYTKGMTSFNDWDLSGLEDYRAYGTTLQIIRRRFYENYEDVLRNFDITVCKVLTDGNTFILDDQTREDIENRVLRVSKHNPHIVKRIVKYWTYGYVPSRETLEYVSKHPHTEFTQFTDYDYV